MLDRQFEVRLGFKEKTISSKSLENTQLAREKQNDWNW
jgi:hypothetical protein